eukprot:746740-Hanusia_phi.AAC.2
MIQQIRLCHEVTCVFAELKKVFHMSWEQLASSDGKSQDGKNAKKPDNSWETDGCFIGPGDDA